MFNIVGNKLKFRSVKAINDPSVILFLNKISKKINLNKILVEKRITKKFLKNYIKWIKSSKLNKLKNLEKFKHQCFASGSSQVFDFFYAKNKNRNFRAFKGEYAYHFSSWRNNYKWEYIKKLNIKRNDAVVISLPFSDTGSKHEEMEKLILKCDKLNVPVLVDCCYFSMCKGVEFDFNHTSIKEIAFSLSKAFPISRIRIGMRLSKKDDDDPLFFINKLDLVNRLSSYLGLMLIQNFKFDYLYNKYAKYQKKICKKMHLEPSSVVSLALGGNKWKMYNRGNKKNRLCLSSLYEVK